MGQGWKVIKQERGKKFRWVLALLLIIGCLSLIVEHKGSGKTDGNLESCRRVTLADFGIEVNTIGVLDAASSHMIASEVRGDKGKIIYLVPDGSRVKKGDVLIQLDQTPFEEEVRRLEGEVASLKESLEATRQLAMWEKNQIEREISTAEYKIRIATLAYKKLIHGDGPLKLAELKGQVEKLKAEERNYQSYVKDLKKLAGRGDGNEVEIAAALSKVKELQDKLKTAERQYLTYKNYVFPAQCETYSANVQQAKTELGQARKGAVFRLAKAMAAVSEAKAKLDTHRNALQFARAELAKTVIRAPSSGIAVLYETFHDGQRRKPRIGDKVWQNQPLLYLPDVSEMIVKTMVREVDLYKIRPGEKCRIRVDAYPSQTYTGQVSTVGALAERKGEKPSGEKYFRLIISMNGNTSVLRPGMTARCTIDVAQVKNAIVVPIAAVFYSDGTTYCYRRLAFRRFKKCEVKVGQMNEDLVEIRSGLRPGDYVALFKPE